MTWERTYTDEQRSAVGRAASWLEVTEIVGVSGPSAVVTLKGHAARLGLNSDHLAEPTIDSQSRNTPALQNLSRSGSLLAAAWFTLCGQDVSWPLEPTRYDLLVRDSTRFHRVQVKTTMTHSDNTWKVFLSTSGRQRRPYDTNEIDEFFVIDGDLNYYLIPVEVVGGFHMIHLRAYSRYRLPKVANL